MTSVNISSISNTVVVTENGSSTVVTVPATNTVTAITAGPQGPQGPQGESGLLVDADAKINGSIVYYDSSSSQFKADAIWTTTTLTDGGNF